MRVIGQIVQSANHRTDRWHDPTHHRRLVIREKLETPGEALNRPSGRQADSGRDNVTLGNDRRTLSLDLSASSAVDQIRVIV